MDRMKPPAKTKNRAARSLAKLRWSRIPKQERAALVPKNGGKPRIYPVRCTRGYANGAHRFSPYTGRCPCGYQKPPEDISDAPEPAD